MPRDAIAPDTSDGSPAWWDPPSDEVPAVLPISEVIAWTANVAVALVGGQHFTPLVLNCSSCCVRDGLVRMRPVREMMRSPLRAARARLAVLAVSGH